VQWRLTVRPWFFHNPILHGVAPNGSAWQVRPQPRNTGGWAGAGEGTGYVVRYSIDALGSDLMFAALVFIAVLL
jgi:hypothetical protein